MQARCLGGFSVMWVPKLLLPLIKISIFDPLTAIFGPKYVFLVILGQILVSLIHMVPRPTNKTMGTRCLSGSLICVYQNFCSFPKWLGCLAQKWPFLPQNMLSWAHIGLAGSFGALLVGRLVVVSRKTPFFFMKFPVNYDVGARTRLVPFSSWITWAFSE